MKTQRLTMFGLAGLAYLVLIDITIQPAQAQTSSFQAKQTQTTFDPIVAKFFKALHEHDFGTIYKMDYKMQDGVALIRQTTPQFLVEKELQKDYTSQQEYFGDWSGSSQWSYGWINGLMLFNPDTKIIELRSATNPYNSTELVHEIYVSLKFKTGAMPNAQTGKLKETVVKLIFTDSGLFINQESSQVFDANVIIPSDSNEASAITNHLETNSSVVPDALQETLAKAQAGDAKAQLDLGRAYSGGKDVDKNYTEAIKWFRKAAEQGNADAQRSLGIFYHLGQGVDKDDVQAVNWYRKAAEQGNARAQLNLGMMYHNGTGVDKDDVEAAKWLQKSADQGLRPAKDALEKLKNSQ